MTCIVGITDKKTVFIGGDSQGTGYHYNKSIRKDNKIFKKSFTVTKNNKIDDAEIIFGCAGSYRMTQIIRYVFEVPNLTEDDEHEYMVKTFIPALIKCFSENGFLKTENGEISNCYFMCGFLGKLFTVEDDFQVAENYNGVESIGSGREYALGSVMTNINNKNKNYIQIINDALKVASELNITVGGPFHVMAA